MNFPAKSLDPQLESVQGLECSGMKKYVYGGHVECKGIKCINDMWMIWPTVLGTLFSLLLQVYFLSVTLKGVSRSTKVWGKKLFSGLFEGANLDSLHSVIHSVLLISFILLVFSCWLFVLKFSLYLCNEIADFNGESHNY